MYYARSENSKGEKQTIVEHILRVSKLAEEFASSFGCENQGKVIGLLHDLGKYSDLFQNVLEGKEKRINHEAAGAYIAKTNYDAQLASVIFGHHKGLENFANFEAILDSSVSATECCYDKNDRRLSVYGNDGYQKACGLLSVDIKGYQLPSKRKILAESYEKCDNVNISRMLYERMLLSCLVDADYTSAAEHENKDYLMQSTAKSVDFEQLYNKLMAYKNKISQNSQSDSGVNDIRNIVFEACTAAAYKDPGLFTLTAPTGTGKTLALLAFALKHAAMHKKDRVILVLPYLSIIEQNAKIYKEIYPDILEVHSQSKFDESYELNENNEYIKLYTDRWSAPMIITTSVTFFESLFKYKPSDCRRLHNITNSVVIFDEAQSLPTHLIDSTLDTINLLCNRYKSSVLFSTATQPSFDFRDNVTWKPTEIIKNKTEMFQNMKRVDVHWKIDKPISFEKIASEMAKNTSCCAIVNLKKHACELYELVKKESNSEYVYHISTDMCTAHRSKVLKQINYQLDNKKPCRLVSTQCIEAGVDLDFDVIYRSLAPLDSIIQAAGRCNRNGKSSGNVTVFIPEKEKYPSDVYENAASKVKILNSRQKIDINDLAHIEEYYKLLFGQGIGDDPKLLKAIDSVDYETVATRYKLIDKSGFNIIIPYKEEKLLFDEIKNEAIEKGLTPFLISKAQKITVSCYDKNKIDANCEPLYFRNFRKDDIIDTQTNWYLLCNEDMYKDDMGLCLSDEINLIF